MEWQLPDWHCSLLIHGSPFGSEEQYSSLLLQSPSEQSIFPSQSLSMPSLQSVSVEGVVPQSREQLHCSSGSHNLLPIEFFIYAVVSIFTVGGVFLGRFICRTQEGVK